ncbi:ATP-binding cassette domain-containing protein [Neolewinella aurantiaca]|uniref:ATP-binding cassette domain-containing protein n=1 Tax=Neolewinella aurantiaca TaxID=2602767 RepID=A0A5C7FG30_9BACT|nr:ATP-binding cassette domain-containing protein [Neolewinella aurantiaca]TXF88559.1 ATP-binding cassette domain-containing protein [Neolewinella aurantiaca]
MHPVTLKLDKAGKRFGRHWIIRDFTDTFSGGELIGIKGRNGSGKSTLLRLLCGQLTPSRGSSVCTIGGKEVAPAVRYKHVAWTGPYLEIVEELTIVEFLQFHFALKPMLPGLTLTDIPQRLELDHVRNRKITDCSSGMRQRVLLGSALYAATEILLLDEPTVTLDEEAAEWFHSELRKFRHERLVFIASNDPDDLRDCTRMVTL